MQVPALCQIPSLKTLGEGFSVLFGKCEIALLTVVCELCCVMLVQQIQSHYGDTSPDSELGLTVGTAATGETEKPQFILATKDVVLSQLL